MADATKIDPRWAWEAYRPSAKAPWDVRRVGHLYRRAAFGSTLADLESGLKNGPEKTIAGAARRRPRAGRVRRAHDAPGREHRQEQQRRAVARLVADADAVLAASAPGEAHALLAQPLRHQQRQGAERPLHARAVRPAAQARPGQLRRSMLQEMSNDPAMLVWLDGRGSKKGSPNENYARELMELFCLGIGNYTEKDIREAARAFTGWDIVGGKPVFTHGAARRRREDRPGPDGQVASPTTSSASVWSRSPRPYFIAGKLFASWSARRCPRRKNCSSRWPTQFRKSDYDFGGLVKTMLSRNLFFSEAGLSHEDQVAGRFRPGHRRRRWKDGSARRPWRRRWSNWGRTCSTRRRSRAGTAAQAWLNGQTLLFRQNLALALTRPRTPRFGTPHRPGRPGPQARQEERTRKWSISSCACSCKATCRPSRAIGCWCTSRNRPRRQTPVYWTAQDAADHRVRACAIWC